MDTPRKLTDRKIRMGLLLSVTIIYTVEIKLELPNTKTPNKIGVILYLS